MEAPVFLLETDRLGLRPFTVDDLDDLAALLGDPETMRYYPRPYTREEALAWITDNIRRHREDGYGLWVIVAKESGEFLGDCGPAIRIVEGREEVELGWHVKRSHWGRGIAPEAAAACRDHAFGTLGLSRVISLIRPENVQSRRVAEKIGMAVEREVDYHGFRHLVYAIQREPGSG